MNSIHLPFGWTLLAAVLSMAAQDGLGTFLVVAEAKGKAQLAGIMDALGDLAGVVVTVTGVGTVLTNGFTWHSAIILAAITLTSYIGTIYFTTQASTMKTELRGGGSRATLASGYVDLDKRVAELEARAR